MEKAVRPKVLGGINVKSVTGCGNMYIQLGWCKGRLFEIFATLGKAGGCATCFNESLTRSITTGLRCGVDVSEYIRQLRGVRCPTPMPFPKEDSVMSCPDAIGRVLEVYGSLTAEGMIKLVLELEAPQNGQSDEEEMREAVKRMEELKKVREESNL